MFFFFCIKHVEGFQVACGWTREGEQRNRKQSVGGANAEREAALTLPCWLLLQPPGGAMDLLYVQIRQRVFLCLLVLSCLLEALCFWASGVVFEAFEKQKLTTAVSCYC